MTDRNDKGQFAKGSNANPKGRPRNRVAEKIRAQLSEYSDEIIQRLMQLVREGDTSAIKIAVERLVPALKPEALPTGVAGLEKALQAGKAPRDLGRVILMSIALGEVDAATGARLLQGLGVAVQLDELEELRQRLARIEDPDSVDDLI